jgi:hypothetical protein
VILQVLAILTAASLAGPAPVQKRLFGRVFQAPPGIAVIETIRASLPGNPRVVCGLTILRGDPAVDARMPRAVPDAGVRFTLRRVVPSECHD